MKVTIGVPIYNQKLSYFRECLDSIKNQTCQDFEVVVIDDGSDNNEEVEKIVKEYGYRYIYQKNRGIGAARQACVDNASKETKFISFCSSDDLLEPNFIKTMLKAAEEHPDKILYSDYYVIDKDLKLIEKRDIKPIEDHDDFCVACFEKASRDTMFVCFGTVFIPKKVFDKVQFDPEIRHSEDLDFLLRSMKLYKYHLVKEYLMRYRISPTMTTQKEYENIPIINKKVLKKCKAFWEDKNEK